MKRKISKIITYIFVILLVLPSLCWGIILLIPEAKEVFHKDIGENRQLAEISEDVSLSNITSQWEAYYSDHAPFRNVLIQANQKINGVIEKNYMSSVQPFLLQCFYGKEGNVGTLELYVEEEAVEVVKPVEIEENDKAPGNEAENHNYRVKESVEPDCTTEGYTVYLCSDCGNEYTEKIPAKEHEEVLVEEKEASYESYGRKIYQCINCAKCRWADFEPKLVDTSYFPQVLYNNQVIQGRYDWLFYVGDSSVSYFRGTNIYSQEEMQEKLALMQELQDICDEKEIELVFMVMPNKGQVYPEYMPTYETVAERKRLDIFGDYVRENSIKFVYPLEELKAGKMYYDTYYKYDTHWNSFGAFIGAMALCETLGIETTDVRDLQTRPCDDVMLGLFITGNLDPANYPPDREVIFDYKTDIQILNSVGTNDIKHGYTPVYKSESSAENQCNFVMLGDSFRVNMIPYLQKEFSNTTFVQRQNMAEAKSEIQNADVLVISAVERFDEDIFVRIPALISYLSE